jgi:hypothetical protein
MKNGRKKAYAAAGVDIALGNRVKKGLQEKVRSTYGPEVLGRIGGFGGLFRADFRELKEPILVSSIDGVGTKLKVAIALGNHGSIAQDLVNHCINDIAVTGARPLFFLDYIGAQRLDPVVFDQLISGFAKACKEGGCVPSRGIRSRRLHCGLGGPAQNARRKPNCAFRRIDRTSFQWLAHKRLFPGAQGFNAKDAAEPLPKS